jgi:thioesterase domain-containing protein/acyl carrier protein
VARTIPDARIAHTLRFMLSGGMAFPPLIRDQIEEVFGVPVLEHYGLSEAAQVACNQPPPGSNKLGTCGKPWAGSVIIVGADGEMLAAGDQGEILVTGDTVISGYLNDPEMSHPAFVDGWFHTGDIGSLDAEGFLTLHARKKELINRGGQKIAPIEIESVLLRHPAVAEAAAFAVPHPRLGEDVGAAVVLEPGAAIVDNDLKAFLAGCLASFKVPHRILIVDRLPKTANGKLLRRQMAQSWAANAGTEPGATITSAESVALERKILALWRKLLQSDQIGVDDDFFDSGGDSLQALEMLAELERTIEQPIPTGLLFGASTVRQIVDRLHRQAERFDANVIYLHSGGNRPPLLLFHGDYENNSPFFLVGLARCLGPDQPIIGIAPHGVAGDPIPDSIAAMAASRLELILRLQPVGPYRIGGFCNGAMVACETARLLSGIGRRVELLILIDPPSIGVHRVFQSILSTMRFFSAGTATWVWRWMVRSEKASRMSVPEMGEYFWSGLRPRLNRALSPRMYAPYFRRALLPTTREKQFSAVMAQYHPKPLDVQAVYYAGAYNGIRWRSLFPKLEVVQVPGGHYGSLTTHMDCLAKHLRAKLDALSPEASDPDIRIVAIARSVRTDEPADLHPRSV